MKQQSRNFPSVVGQQLPVKDEPVLEAAHCEPTADTIAMAHLPMTGRLITMPYL